MLILYPFLFILKHLVFGLDTSDLILQRNVFMLSIFQLIELSLQGRYHGFLLSIFVQLKVQRTRHIRYYQFKLILYSKIYNSFYKLIPPLQLQLALRGDMKNQNQHEQKNQSDDSMEDKTQTTIFQQFKQQMLKAWLPIPTLTKTITLFFIMSAIFIAVGIPMMILSNQIVQIRIRYDHQCAINTVCTLTFSINEKMPNPVFVYYELDGYYQNHRLYAQSLSEKQLNGEVLSVGGISQDCTPITLNSQLYKTVAIDGTPLVAGQPANPCGIIAYSIFNDSFVLQKQGSTISVTTNGIAWPSDMKKYKISDASKQWLNVTDPRFMNWMRIASLPDFRKLWGRINADVESGVYTVQVTNNYDVSPFGTTKYFVLSTSNFFGSKNTFLSILYLVMGVLCFLVGLGFLIRKINKKSKEI